MYLEKIVSGIKLIRPSHGYYEITFESDNKFITKRFLKEELENDELLLMILGYLGEDRIVDEDIIKDFPWIINYLFNNNFVTRVSDKPLIFIEVTYNLENIEIPDPIKDVFEGDKNKCIEYITSLYENN